MKAEIISKNVQTAITNHIKLDPEFKLVEQTPTDAQPEPKMLVKADGAFAFSWTPGQHARYLMEKLRQGIHSLQAADHPRGLDSVALSGAREFWPKLRDVACKESPGSRYYDLDGAKNFCPAK